MRVDSQRSQIQLRPPRDYQVNICAAAEETLKTRQRTLVVSPTASGKTLCMLMMAQKAIARGHRVLMAVPAHLVGQTFKRAKEAGFMVSFEKANNYAELWADLIIASVDTLASSSERLERFDPEWFGLLLVDEGHHAMARTWRKVIDHFELAKVVGFTATPDRADCQPILEVFTDVCFEYTIQEAIKDGWLSPIVQRFVTIEGLDYTQVRRDARDLNSGDLDALLNNAETVRLMAEGAGAKCGDRPTIVFCSSVAHAHAFAEYLSQSMGKSAGVVDGKMRKSLRRKTEQAFHDGELQYLCNVGCLAEGWDSPRVAAVVQARATASRALYAQQIGRGLRLYPGKSDCLVIDFVGNSHDHSLVHAAHVMDPDLDDEVADRAAKMQLDDPDLGVADAIQLAIEACELEQAEDRLRRKVLEDRSVAKIDSDVEIDPFVKSDTAKVFELFDIDRLPDRWERESTPNQLEALRRLGVKEPEVLNRREASALLDRLIGRSRQKRATLRQVRILIKAGTHPDNAMALSFEKASRGIEELKANGWRRPLSWGPRQTEPHPSASHSAPPVDQAASDR